MRRTKAQRARFFRLACEMVEGFGAELLETHLNDPSKEYRLVTPAGILMIHVFDGWVAGCFTNPQHAARFVDCNPYSGKWNHHHWPGCDPAVAVRDIYAKLDHLCRSLPRLKE